MVPQKLKLLSLHCRDEGFFDSIKEQFPEQLQDKGEIAMIKPSSSQIQEMAGEYSVIPICREIYADVITPITLLRKLRSESDCYYLLESIEGGEQWGRYSFLGYDPIVRVTCKDGAVTVEGDVNREIKTDRPMDVLRKILARYKAPKLSDLPPFAGGFVGYFSYSMIGYAEPVLKLKESSFYDYEVMLFDKVIAFDNLTQKISVIVNMKTDDLLSNYGRAIENIDQIVRIICDNTPLPKEKNCGTPEFTCSVTKEEYAEKVEKTKEYIRNGDIFQAVISRQFEAEYEGSLLNAYRVLRTTNPSPYMVYLKSKAVELICSSPETLVKLKDGRLSTFPVAGSRPRGETTEQDQMLAKELLNDEKELSEHNMLVDLARNDLGKISRFSSVEVTDYQMIHRYSRIMHIASEVQSDILETKDACDAVEAILPAGTLSGAPKIRACEIIEEQEQIPRGIYGGAIGYMDFTGNLDVCIAIRMAVKKDGKVYVQSGGGIVADSVPDKEYEESENKAKAVIQALKAAGGVDAQ